MVVQPGSQDWYFYNGNPASYPADHRFAYYPKAENAEQRRIIDKGPYSPGGSGSGTTSTEVINGRNVEVHRDDYGNVVGTNPRGTYNPSQGTNDASFRKLTPDEALALGRQPRGEPAIGSQLYEKNRYLQRGTSQWASEQEWRAKAESIASRTGRGYTLSSEQLPQQPRPIQTAWNPGGERGSILDRLRGQPAQPPGQLLTYQRPKKNMRDYQPGLKWFDRVERDIQTARQDKNTSIFSQFNLGVGESLVGFGKLGYATGTGLYSLTQSQKARQDTKEKLKNVPRVAAQAVPDLFASTRAVLSEGGISVGVPRMAGQLLGTAIAFKGISAATIKLPTLEESLRSTNKGVRSFASDTRASMGGRPVAERTKLNIPTADELFGKRSSGRRSESVEERRTWETKFEYDLRTANQKPKPRNDWIESYTKKKDLERISDILYVLENKDIAEAMKAPTPQYPTKPLQLYGSKTTSTSNMFASPSWGNAVNSMIGTSVSSGGSRKTTERSVTSNFILFQNKQMQNIANKITQNTKINLRTPQKNKTVFSVATKTPIPNKQSTSLITIPAINIPTINIPGVTTKTPPRAPTRTPTRPPSTQTPNIPRTPVIKVPPIILPSFEGGGFLPKKKGKKKTGIRWEKIYTPMLSLETLFGNKKKAK